MGYPTYNLWFKPGCDAGLSLAQTILKLAQELGTPFFEPHVTLLANLAGTADEHLRRSKALAASLRPFEIVLTNASYHDTYFQCIFLCAEKSPAIISARETARHLFEKTEETYMPHLSLVYGSFSVPRKQEIIRNLSADLRTSFAVNDLFLIRADSSNPQDWHEISAFTLIGR